MDRVPPTKRRVTPTPHRTTATSSSTSHCIEIIKVFKVQHISKTHHQVEYHAGNTTTNHTLKKENSGDGTSLQVRLTSQGPPLACSSRSPTLLSIDVGKYKLEIYNGQTTATYDTPVGMEHILNAKPQAIVLEPTGAYSQKIVKAALAAGIIVYYIDTTRFKKFRESMNPDVKNDACDAKAIHKFYTTFGAQPHIPPNPSTQTLLEILKKRNVIVKNIRQWKGSLESANELEQHDLKKFVTEQIKIFSRERDRIDKALEKVIDLDLAKICGPLLTVKLTTLDPLRFETKAKWICYLGLHMKVWKSGEKELRNKLSKRGDSEARSMLNMAVLKRLNMKQEPYYSYYWRLRDLGHSNTVAKVATMRKIAIHFWARYREKYKHK